MSSHRQGPLPQGQGPSDPKGQRSPPLKGQGSSTPKCQVDMGTSIEVKVKVDTDPVSSSKTMYQYLELFPHLFLPASTAAAPTVSTVFSKNCQNFNRLFHSSFDEESIDNQELKLMDCDIKVKGQEPDTVEPRAVDVKPSPVALTRTSDGSQAPNGAEDEKIRMDTVFDEGKMKFDGTVFGDEKMKIDDKGFDDEKMKIEDTVFDDEKIKMDDTVFDDEKSSRGQRKSNRVPLQSTSKTQEAQIMRRITITLKKDPLTLSDEDKSLLDAFPTLVRIVRKRFEARLLSTERLKEFEDGSAELEEKCKSLAAIISGAKYLVVYSGAGISTSANIPDFRGTTGLWTLLKSGQALDSQNVSTTVLTSADPTVTHMALKQLYADGIVKHIVSQNCDGLHLRSGIPKMGLSEIHGNMYIEVCSKCGRDYARTFDVAENTRRHEHRTGRRCYNCHNPLRDTIVHFGERGKLRWPINWAGAEYNAHRADVILCIGSSLKVLRRYPWLWCMDKPATKRPKLVIVNLMWTPKDQFAALKIHGRCDDVMTRVMQKLHLQVPVYSRLADPLFRIATPLHVTEVRARSSRELTFPENEPLPLKLVDMNNYMQFEPVFCHSSATNSSDDDPEPDLLTLRSTTSKKGSKKLPHSKGQNRIIKGIGNGWLGNLTPGVKMKKRKVKQ